MPLVGFEATIPLFERAKYRAATVSGFSKISFDIIVACLILPSGFHRSLTNRSVCPSPANFLVLIASLF
jgi:hypothetical protein